MLKTDTNSAALRSHTARCKLSISTPIRNQHTSNTRTRQRRNDATEQRTNCHFGDPPTTPGRQLRQDANLDAYRRDVAEAADGVGCDEAGAVSEMRVGRVGG